MEAFRQLWRGSWRTGPLLSRMTSAEIVALFITAMDKLKLDIRSMDYLHKDDYMFIGDTDQVDNSQACDELDEVQARQLCFNLVSAYLICWSRFLGGSTTYLFSHSTVVLLCLIWPRCSLNIY